MRRFAPFLALVPVLAMAQTDHDNIDAGRPLRFEDAEPVAFGTLAFEYGLGVGGRRSLLLDGTAEFIWGVALNGQLEIGVSPFLRDARGGVRDYDLAYLHSFRQEIGNAPALALKVEASFPGLAGGRNGYKLRGIATKTVGPYGRVHLNLDADFGDRSGVGMVLGFTNPIGYPREFNTTGLAEIAIRAGEPLGLGLGVRRQISPRAVLDLGLQTNIDRSPLRLVAGLSTSF